MDFKNSNSGERGLSNTDPKRPSVFDYLDYREFLKDLFSYKKEQNKNFSLAVFSRKAGITSRNYLKRIVDGERHLSTQNIPKFCIGFDLSKKESLFFEALVHYNQANDDIGKKHYFHLLCAASENEKNSAMELIKNQYEVFSHWYILAIRELLWLTDFQENTTYIAKKLKGKISPKEAEQALKVLQKCGLTKRNDEGRLVPSSPRIRYNQDIINMQVREFHNQMLDRTKEAMRDDSFESWNARALTLAIPQNKSKEIQEEINQFFNTINNKYTLEEPLCQQVIQVNIQMFELTTNTETRRSK